MAEPVVDNNPNPSGGPDYKAKLDEAASRVKSPPQENQGTGIIDKGAYSLVEPGCPCCLLLTEMASQCHNTSQLWGGCLGAMKTNRRPSRRQ